MIYLDHAATSPLAPEVAQAMSPWLAPGAVGNASSLHAAGRAARAAVEDARDQVAAALGVTPLEILFTSGGTEADNAAVKGLFWAARQAGGERGRGSQVGGGSKIVTTAIEHHAVLEACEWLRDHDGATLEIVEVQEDGIVDTDRLLDHVDDRTVLVTVMVANNELGTVQPVDVLGPVLAERGIAFHADAVQAFGRMPLDLAAWTPTSIALSAHKFNGPGGVGVWMLRRDAAPHPVLHGGGQERGVRSGTLNVAGIVGMGAAAELAVARLEEEQGRLRDLRDILIADLTALDGVTLNGHPTRRLCNNVHVAVADRDPETLLMSLDRAGIACATGSACQSGAAQRSHVLDAIGADEAAHIRLSLGSTTTAQDVEEAGVIFRSVVASTAR